MRPGDERNTLRPYIKTPRSLCLIDAYHMKKRCASNPKTMRIEFLSDAHRISKRCASNFKTMPIEQTGERGIPPAKPRIYGVTKPSWPYRKGNGAVFTSYTHGFAIASLYFDQGQVLLFHAPRYMDLSRHVTLAQTDMSPWGKQTCLLGANRHVSLE